MSIVDIIPNKLKDNFLAEAWRRIRMLRMRDIWSKEWFDGHQRRNYISEMLARLISRCSILKRKLKKPLIWLNEAVFTASLHSLTLCIYKSRVIRNLLDEVSSYLWLNISFLRLHFLITWFQTGRYFINFLAFSLLFQITTKGNQYFKEIIFTWNNNLYIWR